MTEGRSCPLAYRYRADQLCAEPIPVSEDVIYVIGGLYGNPQALTEIERMARAEEQAGRRVRLVFNGDFNWFNASDELFQDINRRVLRHTVSLGNVEFELANPSDEAGCGCAYPDFVDQGVVERSNRIMTRLQGIAAHHPELQDQLARQPRYLCLMFGGLKILVVHGDPDSLAGWGLAHEAFSAGNDSAVQAWFQATDADVIACTHTCLPVLWSGRVGERARTVVNNGSAGMGNLYADARGLITRISTEAPVGGAVVGHDQGSVRISLVPVAFDLEAWLPQFDGLWPAGSDAALSYRSRIVQGASLAPEQAVFGSVL